MSEAESRASNAMFANMNRARAFARCMGDDMATSTAGFADPFADGKVKSDGESGGEILWTEGVNT